MTPDCFPIIQPNIHHANRIVHRMARQPLARGGTGCGVAHARVVWYGVAPTATHRKCLARPSRSQTASSCQRALQQSKPDPARQTLPRSSRYWP